MDIYNYLSDYNFDGGELILLTFLGIVITAWLISSIFSIIGKWKMFKKAGKEGWPAFIPIYDTVVLCEITGVNPWWIVIIIATRIIGGALLGVGLVLGSIADIYFKIILYVSTARSYGKNDSWAVGLYFLKPFFFFALGVGNSEYQGAKPLSDPILEAVGVNQPTTNKESTEEKKEEKIVCKNCGSENLNSSKFCTSCGKELR